MVNMNETSAESAIGLAKIEATGFAAVSMNGYGLLTELRVSLIPGGIDLFLSAFFAK